MRIRICFLVAVVAALLGLACKPSPEPVAEAEPKVEAPVEARDTPPDPADPDSYVGSYEVVRINMGNRVDNKKLAPGQRMILELRSDKTWLMYNMMSGWDGTWALKDKQLVLTQLNDPAGPSPDAEPMVLTPQPDRSKLTYMQGENGLEFLFDPNIKRMTDAAFRGRIIDP